MKEIPLTQGKVALVDDEDFERVNKFKWSLTRSGYASRNVYGLGKRLGVIYMHRFILEEILGGDIDHRDGDRLNNRRSNLRAASRSQNRANSNKQSGSYSSKFKGVCFSKRRSKWVSYVYHMKEKKHLGYFKNEKDAALAYNAAAKIFHGEFSRLNEVNI